jgi:MFS family permease
MIIIMFTGITFGGALPGLISATLVPQHGWQVLFLIGGVVPIVAAVLAIFLLPESLKFLVLKNRSREAIVQSSGLSTRLSALIQRRASSSRTNRRFRASRQSCCSRAASRILHHCSG